MIIQGFIYMIVGMTVVFSFLSLMVIVMYLSTPLINLYDRFFPEEVKSSAPKVTRALENHEEIAAVVAAVSAYSK